MDFFKRHCFEFLLLGIILVLFLTNYHSGTYLSGWDNLQTDLNPLLGVKRAVYSLWEEYQSLGLLAGMGHAADIVRAAYIWILSFIVPASLLRYIFHFSMLFLGGFGMLKLLTLSGLEGHKKKFAFLGSLFYLFNFEVTQMMFFPFEPFSVFVGLLPFEIWIFLKVITQKASRRDWLLFILINLMATPQGVAQQLFVVYCLLLGLITMGIFISTKSRSIFKKAFLALILILSLNSFWLMPQVYFLATSGAVVKESKINQIATQDVLYANKDKGNIADFLRFEGFFYDRVDQNQNHLFTTWKEYRNLPVISIGIFALSLLSLAGLLIKSKFRLGFALCLGLIGLSLLSNTPPFTFINDLIRENGFVNQIFRSPFTKFSIPFALISAYFFAITLSHLDRKFKLKIKHFHLPIVFILGLGLVLGTTLPSFNHQSISQVMQVKYPQPYLDMINYFKTVDKNKRIGLLPEYTFWGWYHYRWGYDGSGFLWYGIEQPIISRTFDVWSFTSEGYFWELKSALEAEDPQGLENVFNKYDVDYVLFDTSLMPIVSSTKGIQYQSITALLEKTPSIHKVKSFGFLSLYQIDHKTPIKSFVTLAHNVPNIGPKVVITNRDTAYNQNGMYQTNPSKAYDLYYPFLDLMTQTQLANNNWNITELPATWAVSTSLPHLSDYTLVASNAAVANLYRNNKAVQYNLPLSIETTSDSLRVNFPKIRLDSFVPSSATVASCGPEDGGLIRSEIIDTSLKLIARNGAIGCINFEDLDLDQRYGYLLSIKNENNSGQPFFFYTLDKTKDQAYVEDRLNEASMNYIIGSKYVGGLGYAFTFQSTSLPTVAAINTLQSLTVDLLPYDELKDMKLTKNNNTVPLATTDTVETMKKDSYYHYTLSLRPDSEESTLVLNQSFHPGWKAYRIPPNASPLTRIFPFLFAEQITNHVPINNWANGWTIPSHTEDENIVLIFGPQHLEYVGFVLIGIVTVLVLGALSRKRRT
jgi:hypothetical protein